MEDQSKPIKRHQSLQPVSREHHHTLMLVWKIRKALREHVELDRIDQYVTWFYQQYIKPHFEVEEKFIFPVLGNQDVLIEQALDEHKQLNGYFEAQDKDDHAFLALADLLENHIRFEERILFNLIQERATEQQLSTIAEMSGDDQYRENEQDSLI